MSKICNDLAIKECLLKMNHCTAIGIVQAVRPLHTVWPNCLIALVVAAQVTAQVEKLDQHFLKFLFYVFAADGGRTPAM